MENIEHFISEKAGAKATLPDGVSQWSIFNGEILVSNGLLHQAIVDKIK